MRHAGLLETESDVQHLKDREAGIEQRRAFIYESNPKASTKEANAKPGGVLNVDLNLQAKELLEGFDLKPGPLLDVHIAGQLDVQIDERQRRIVAKSERIEDQLE